MASGTELEILLKVAAGAALGGIIGFEREMKNKPAGFRTTMLVGAGTTLLMALGPVVLDIFGDVSPDLLRADPFRIIEAIIVGISFIGAGMILQQKGNVKHLTTAATTLIVAGVGIAVALEQYWLAVGVTLLALAINAAMQKVERLFT